MDLLSSRRNDPDVIILGAGFSGLCAAIDLKRAGHDSFVVLEKADDLGGTWRDNSYPGAECDVPSHLYSFSFAPKADWSKYYGTWAEILGYMHDCAQRFGVVSHIRFGEHVTEARWDDGHWRIFTTEGRSYRTRFLIAGLGGLHTPNVPNFEGLSSYSGVTFHTSAWRHDIDLMGRRVAMIGTGATAVQAAPEVAKVAEELFLFQRSPIWVTPKKDPIYTAGQQAEFNQNPQSLRRHRWELWQDWEVRVYDLFREGTAVNRKAEAVARENIARNVHDKELVAALTPTYNITCKRPTLSSRYYPMFNQSNAHLITEPILGITRAGIVTGRLEIPVDVIIFATGFKAFNIATEVNLIGVDGITLAEAWAERISAFASVMVPRFPNLFILLGPNSAGLTSSIQMIEAASAFALRGIDYVNATKISGIQPCPEQVDEFLRRIDEVSATTTVNRGCTSWWTDGGRQNHTTWPESSVTYRMLLKNLCLDEFDRVPA